MKDLKVFSAFNEDLFKEITQLLTLDNFRYVFAICAPFMLLYGRHSDSAYVVLLFHGT